MSYQIPGSLRPESTPRSRVLASMASQPERFARSNWLSKALADMEARDPCDAVNDAEALLASCQARLDRIMQEASR